jgi:hypothetical protein
MAIPSDEGVSSWGDYLVILIGDNCKSHNQNQTVEIIQLLP